MSLLHFSPRVFAVVSATAGLATVTGILTGAI